jgi:hypothetical protein
VGSRPDSPVFTGPEGGTLYRRTFARCWRRACTAVSVEHLHFHDLRPTGNTLAATTGASTKELMVRMGHANPLAALLYQHAIEDWDRAIAEALSDLARTAKIRPLRPVPESWDDGGTALHRDSSRHGPRDGRDMDGPGRGTAAPKGAADLERTTGFEPATPTLARLCSTS